MTAPASDAVELPVVLFSANADAPGIVRAVVRAVIDELRKEFAEPRDVGDSDAPHRIAMRIEVRARQLQALHLALGKLLPGAWRPTDDDNWHRLPPMIVTWTVDAVRTALRRQPRSWP